ncbi:MAG: glycosyltransferase [Phycisphaerales bacterium]|nr:glycosyltransferase [Phycisphaerales bacterium]
MAYRYLVVIPAYNEAATIEEVARSAQQYADVCVVDDASRDETADIVSSIPDVHCIRHKRNTHIPQTTLDGMRYGYEQGYDFCITMDAGMSHDPNAIPAFQERSDADLVIGCRQRKIDVPRYRRALSWSGNRLLNLTMNQRFVPWGGAGLSDCTSGYRMFSRVAVDLLLRSSLRSRSFDFHLESLTFVYRHGLKIVEIPIVYRHTGSSLRWNVVGHALQTCFRLHRGSWRP